MDKEKLFAQIKGGLIVSCQALETEPLYTKEGGVMPLMAKAAAMSGAVGIRANTVRDITQIKQVVDLPVIGIIKKDYPGTPMYITVTMKEVDELVACGVDILAVQGTGALRPDGSTSAQFIRAIKAKYPEQLVMADCDNFENAMLCAEAGADFVGTTMRGYTPETTGIDDIDFDFTRKLSAECPAKIIAEGHIHYPEQAVKALEAGAFALVVGGALLGRFISNRTVAVSAAVNKIESAQDIQTWFTGYGLEVDGASITADKVKIPRRWDDSFSAFNGVVQQSGMDLARYKGKTVEKWSALLPAASSGETSRYGVLLVYKKKAVGAYLLEKPSGTVLGLQDAQNELAKQTSGEDYSGDWGERHDEQLTDSTAQQPSGEPEAEHEAAPQKGTPWNRDGIRGKNDLF